MATKWKAAHPDEERNRSSWCDATSLLFNDTLIRDLSRDAVSYNRDASRLMTLKMRIKLWPRRRFAGE